MPNQKTTKVTPTNANFSIEPTQSDAVLYSQEYTQELLAKSVEDAMKNDLFPSKIELGEKQKYQGSEEQLKTYENLEMNDPGYSRYIIQTYGSFQNFLRLSQIYRNPYAVFDPRTDFKSDVTVITQNKFFKADHISPNELIMEALTGKCTVDYLDKNGYARKMVATLNKTVIPSGKMAERYNFFNPLQNNRIVLFDLVKNDWSSFFMKNMVRFVRDDTLGIE